MSLSPQTKSVFSFLFRVVLSVALLWYVFSKIDFEQTAEVLRSANLNYIVLAGIIFFAMNGILLYRWMVFIRALDLTTTTGNVVLHFFYGAFGNLFLPTAIGGDILKAVGLCKNSTQKPKVIASIILDRISGFASIAIVAVTGFTVGYTYIDDKVLIVPIILMGAGCLTVAVILLNERIYSLFCRIFDWFPKFKNSMMKLHYDIALLKESDNYKAGIKAILLSCLSQVVFAWIFYLTARGLQQEIPIIYFLIFIPIICVISAFPSIGGLGVRELGAAYLFGRIGVESGIAVSLTLINFLFMVLVGLIGGILYVYTLSAGRVQHYPSDAGADPQEA